MAAPKNTAFKPLTWRESIWRRTARRVLVHAVSRGRIVKPGQCSACGIATPKTQLHGHHDDYDEPLRVRWLCKRCHRAEHDRGGRERDQGATKPTREPDALSDRQGEVLAIVDHYTRAIGEPCPSAYVARRLSLHHSTVRQHFAALYRKGFLRSPNAPAVLRER